jgi:hypothetical protein
MSYTDLDYKFKRIGKNVQIGRNVYFRYPSEVEIGDNVVIDEFCYFTTSVSIGNHCHIAPSCSVIGGRDAKFVMEDFCGMAAGVRIVCGSDDYLEGLTNVTIPTQFHPNTIIGEVVMRRHSIIGTNSVVMPNVTLEEGTAIGAMSVVMKSTMPWRLHIGNPAKPLLPRNRKSIEEGERKFLQWWKEHQ